MPARLPPLLPLQASGAGGPAPSSDSQADSPQLSDEQQRVLELVLAGRSVFFTGDAGTGKSFLLNRIIDALRQKHGADFASSVRCCC